MLGAAPATATAPTAGHGRELQSAVTALDRWGARTMTAPRPGEITTVESRALSFHTAFRPEAAGGDALRYEVRMADATFRLSVDGPSLTVGHGPHPDPDLVVETLAGRPVLDLMRGTLPPDEALASGRLRVEGPPALLTRFAEIFRL